MDVNMEQLENNPVPTESNSAAAVKVRVPKRVLHFSDGVIEEFSDDEVDSTPQPERQTAIVDPATLTWGPWMWYKMWAAGSSTLSICDYLGESLASFMGITTPKYYFEIEEYKRREEEKRKYEEQRVGWSETGSDVQLVTKERVDRVEGPTPV